MGTLDLKKTPSLAERLGTVAHVSPLLRKACLLSGCTEQQVGQWLLKSAVLRGASHYQRDFPTHLPPDSPELTHEEIGVALCLGQHSYESTFLRAAAQLLSSPDTDPARLARLAVRERVESVLLYIANIAARIEPAVQPWAYLREHLHCQSLPPTDVLPHWSRFVSQTGFTVPTGAPAIKWLHRQQTRP